MVQNIKDAANADILISNIGKQSKEKKFGLISTDPYPNTSGIIDLNIENSKESFAGLIDSLISKEINNNHLLITTARKYDGISAGMTRRFKSPRENRYNWKWQKSLKKIDFKQLSQEIQDVVNNGHVRQLYQYIHNSGKLDLLNEAFDYGHTSLRYHLLLITNLIVHDYHKGKLNRFIRLFSKLYDKDCTVRQDTVASQM